MKTLPECIGCFFAQLAKMSDLHGIDANTHELMAKELAIKVPEMNLDCSPPELSRAVTDILIKHLEKDDPYLELKQMENKRAAGMMPEVRGIIESSANPLATALRFAAAANVIDYGVPDHFALKHSTEELAKREFAIFDIETIEKQLNKARKILILGDNTGEVYFDKLLIEQLPRAAKLTYAVRSEPIINDVLLEDAHEAGIKKFAEIVESGSRLPGTVPISVTIISATSMIAPTSSSAKDREISKRFLRRKNRSSFSLPSSATPFQNRRDTPRDH